MISVSSATSISKSTSSENPSIGILLAYTHLLSNGSISLVFTPSFSNDEVVSSDRGSLQQAIFSAFANLPPYSLIL